MGVFILMSGWPLAELTPRLPALELGLHVHYDRRSVHKLGQDICLVHYARDNDFYTAVEQEAVACDDAGQPRSITLLQGYAWRNDDTAAPRPLTAAGIAALIARANVDPAAIRESLNGEYAILQIGSDGIGLAFNDPLGIEHLYYHQGLRRTIVTNRVALAAALLDDAVWDIPSLLWIPLIGYRLGEGTRSPRVRMLQPGGVLGLGPGRLDLRAEPGLPFHDALARASLREEFENQLTRGITSALCSLQAALGPRDPVVLPITGGKDSRLTLALALQAFPSARLRLYTNGEPDHPDARVGQMLAAHLGLAHEVRVPRPVAASAPDADVLLRQLAIHAFQNDGMFGAWDLKAYPRAGRGIVAAGFVGEVFKGYLKQPFHFETLPDPARFIAMHGPYDPLGLLRPETRRDCDRILRERLMRQHASGGEYDDLPDLHYLKERIPNWLGGARRLDAYSQQVVNILNNAVLIRLAFALTARERQQEVIHFRLLHRLAPRLLAVPFAAQRWHPGLRSWGAGPEMHAEPLQAPPGRPLHGSWQYVLNRSPALRARLRELFGDTPASPFWDHLERAALLARLTRGDFSMPQLISFYGLCTVFMAVHQYWIPLPMATPAGAPESHPVWVRDPAAGQTWRLRGLHLDAQPEPAAVPALECRCLALLRAAPRPVAAPVYEGYVDRVHAGRANGWAWCPGAPEQRLCIAIVDPDTGLLLDECLASAFRGDLQRAGKGDGCYAFDYDLERIRGRLSGSRVAFRILEGGFELIRSPVVL